METIKIKKENDSNFMLGQVHIEYWLNKGLSDEEAKQKVKERQSTTSKDSFIERANGDIEEGTKRFLDRLDKWNSSMLKSGMFSGHSKVSVDMFEIIQKQIEEPLLFGRNEYSIRTPSNVYKIDCLLETKSKIIEFYGDYWHANPNKYKPDHIIQSKNPYNAEQKWARDALKIKELNEKGYKTLVIWEMDYKKEPEEVIKKCIDFLRS